MASTFLKYVAEFILMELPEESVYYTSSKILAHEMIELSNQIREGIYQFGIVKRN